MLTIDRGVVAPVMAGKVHLLLAPAVVSLIVTNSAASVLAKSVKTVISLPAAFSKQTQWDDDSSKYFSSEAIVFIIKGKPCLSFRGYSPVTGHSTEFVVPATFIKADTLSFTINDDGWGTAGRGTIVLKKNGCLINMVQTKASVTGLSAGETWLQNEFLPRHKLMQKLPAKCCLEH